MFRKILLLALTLGVFLCGCGGKHKNSEQADSQDNELFVEYNPGYFPENYHSIKTLKNIKASDYKSKRRRANRSDYFIAWNGNEAEDLNAGGARRRLLRAARSAIGTPYVVGGTSPGGFDCSGLVCWAYGNVGVKLPRTAREQSVVGRRICNISDMRAGDIVAFRHPRRGYHTGIYVGDGKFIHSPRRKTNVKINSLDDPYFSSTFLGARRVNLTGREDLLAQAENRLSREYSYEASMRRFKREESRTSHNASRERIRSHNKREIAENKHQSRREMAENKRLSKRERDFDRRRKDRSVKEVAYNSKSERKAKREDLKEKSSKRERDLDRKQDKLDSKRQAKNGKKEDGRKERDRKLQAKSDKSERKGDKGSRQKQVTSYNAKNDKKAAKSDKKKRTASKS